MDGEKPLCLLSLLMHLAYSKSPPSKITLKLRHKWHIAMQRRCNSLISDMVLDSGSAFTIKLVSFKCSGIFRKNVKWATCFCPWDIHINFLPKEVFWLPSTQGASAITLSSNINSLILSEKICEMLSVVIYLHNTSTVGIFSTVNLDIDSLSSFSFFSSPGM